ncbi:hypothetical protein LOAG_06852 [Loa loa]|uniref:PDZ domain-containing protein n=1 Tax=Loa loa TaxID=7209 RepID=A0A1S0TWZ5_LOALO|nr:hypothetical protein LOAG_06852 [Loa loa]EFO21635.1 hypothetical protein LOAG_06852 [Loa loa]
MTISRDKKRGEEIKHEQCVDDKRITKRDGFLYLKVKMMQHKTGTRVAQRLRHVMRPAGSEPLNPRLRTKPHGSLQYLLSICHVPVQLDKRFTIIHNIYKHLIVVPWCDGQHQVKNSKEGHVYVTRVTNESLSAECLMVGDRILQVDGTVINDKEMARKIIVQGLSSRNVSIIVERPDSPKARNFVSEVLSVRTPPNDERLRQV